MKIELPWPDPKLNPNQSKGRHWSSGVSLRKKARNDAHWMTKGAMLQKLMEGDPFAEVITGPLVLTITFNQPDKRARDRDNLLAALKPSLDGVADALGVNDSQFDPITIRRAYGPKPGSVTVEVGYAVEE